MATPTSQVQWDDGFVARCLPKIWNNCEELIHLVFVGWISWNILKNKNNYEQPNALVYYWTVLCCILGDFLGNFSLRLGDFWWQPSGPSDALAAEAEASQRKKEKRSLFFILVLLWIAFSLIFLAFRDNLDPQEVSFDHERGPEPSDKDRNGPTSDLPAFKVVGGQARCDSGHVIICRKYVVWVKMATVGLQLNYD